MTRDSGTNKPPAANWCAGVHDDPRSSSAHRHVALVLRDFAGESAELRKKLVEIAARTGIPRRRVGRIIGELVERFGLKQVGDTGPGRTPILRFPEVKMCANGHNAGGSELCQDAHNLSEMVRNEHKDELGPNEHKSHSNLCHFEHNSVPSCVNSSTSPRAVVGSPSGSQSTPPATSSSSSIKDCGRGGGPGQRPAAGTINMDKLARADFEDLARFEVVARNLAFSPSDPRLEGLRKHVLSSSNVNSPGAVFKARALRGEWLTAAEIDRLARVTQPRPEAARHDEREEAYRASAHALEVAENAERVFFPSPYLGRPAVGV